MTATKTQVVAVGALVRLREKTPDDAERDYGWRCDPELAAYDAARPLTMKFSNYLAMVTEEMKFPTTHRRTYAIEDGETGKHIGNVMYYSYDAFRREAEIGITIGDRDYWSHGYGTDTVNTMRQFLFRELRLRKVYLHTLTWNARAQVAFERAGFQRIRNVSRGGYDFVYMEAYPSEEDDAADA
jgi:RimJ/RimL family protein N-acetyltransferase